MVKRNSQIEHDSQWSKHKACFACATQLWLAVNHNTSITSGDLVQCSKRWQEQFFYQLHLNLNKTSLKPNIILIFFSYALRY